jgi:sn-glycerol 3-phosphate transport system ATP-binding protein
VAQVRLDRVTKRWGAEPAVDNVSFTAEAGSLVVLLGPSGCGKSTTLRLIAGLEAADEGLIEIAGRDVTLAPPVRRGTAMVSVAEQLVSGSLGSGVGQS